MFKFIHVADIHLDSPLRRLEQYEGAPVTRIRSATRRALENLVELAAREQVAFVLIAGDLYDGDLDDYSALLHFSRQMGELRRKGIRAFVIRGNHDAANHMSRGLDLPDNVHLFGEQEPGTFPLESIRVAVHGQSFASREVRENLASGYPDPVPGWYNIGLLHTSLGGCDGHDTYAPCALAHLLQRGYDYWALGHIHQRQLIHHDRPLVIYPGNIQGRHIGESGAKGCHLVDVKDNQVVANEFRALDVMRWACLDIDAARCDRPEGILQLCRERLQHEVQAAENRLLAVRVRVTGATRAHVDLACRTEHWLQQLRSDCLNYFGQDVWIESIRFDTSSPEEDELPPLPEDALEQIRKIIRELQDSDLLLRSFLEHELRLLDRKLPTALKIGTDAMRLMEPDFVRHLLGRILPVLTRVQSAARGDP
jgi:DNA repair exonuclease SbcCD nuclease subunit